MAHRDRLVEAPLLLRLETSSGLRLHRSCVSCCSPRIIGGPPLERSLTRRSEFCFRGQTGKHLLTANRSAFTRRRPRPPKSACRAGLPQLGGGWDGVVIAASVQNNSGPSTGLVGRCVAG